MARIVDPRYVTIAIDDEMQTIDNARVVVRTDIPMKWLRALDERDPNTVIDFLAEVIKEWDGFDLPLSKESLYELTIADIKALSQMVMTAIQDPQKATNAALQ